MSLSDFLRSGRYPESLIRNLEDEKVDCASIMLMSDEDLKVFFPKLGDRLSIKDFCKKSISSKKISLIEKLKEKMNKKARTKENDSPYRPRKCLKNTRVIEIGWLCTSEGDNVFRQVKTKAGGGTRKVNIPKNVLCTEVLEKAKNLFFPNGVSTKGHLDDFEVKLLDYKSHECNLDLTIQQMYELSALTVLRFYMGTIYKKEPVHVDEETFFPQTVTRPPNSPENNVEPYKLHLQNIREEDLEVIEGVELPEVNVIYSQPRDPTEEVDHRKSIFEKLILHRGNIFRELVEAVQQREIYFRSVQIEMIQIEMACGGISTSKFK
nr:uncharacterized protein LOC111510736 [Leptinotarsa decemlineata]